MNKNRLSEFVQFCSLYSINVLASWSEESLFDTTHFVYVNDAHGSGITTEEKARLLNETFLSNIIKTTDI